MDYLLIAVICLATSGNCEVEVIDHGLTESDCASLQPADTKSIRFECEIDGVNWQ